MTPNAIMIPTGLLGSMIEPAALFAAWGVVVVGVLAWLSAVLARDRLADEPPAGVRDDRRAAA